MRKLKLFLIALVGAWFSYCISYYLTQELLIENREMFFEFELSSSENLPISVSYNVFQNRLGATVYRDRLTKNKIKLLPTSYPKYDEIKRIFLSVNKPVTLKLNQIFIKNSYNSVAITASELFQYSNLVSLKNKKGNAAVRLDDSSIIVDFSDQHLNLEIENGALQLLYSKLYNPLFFFSLILGFLAFFPILFYASKSQFIQSARVTQILFFSLFIVIIFTPFLSQKHHGTDENRSLAPFPNLNTNIWKIPSRYTKFYNDHFPFKSELSRFNNYMKYKLYGISPNPQIVKIGKDGWLYCSAQDFLDTYQGTQIFTEADLVKIKNNLQKKEKDLNAKGIEFYLIIPPLKHSVYPEYLPKSLKIKGITKRLQLMEYLKKNSNLNVIDPLPTLLRAKDSVRVYYKNDTHWNQAGAFLVYQQIIQNIKLKFPSIANPIPIDSINVERTIDYEGDLIPLINIKNEFYREPFILSPKFIPKAGKVNLVQPIGNETEYRFFEPTDNLRDKPRLLMYRDSYSSYLYKYLGEHFSYSGFVWGKKIDSTRIENAKPDILVYEILERFIDELIEE